MTMLKRLFGALLFSPIALLLAAGAALAQSADPVKVPITPVTQPHNWQILLQSPESPVEHAVEHLNNFVSVIIIGICVLVGVLLLIVLTRFNHKRHPVPSVRSHNTPLEVAWTLIPALLLVIIAIPSFGVVFYQDHTNDPYMTVNVTGHQWYWEYTYPNDGGIDFNSTFVPDDKLKPGQLRLLTASAPMVVPVGKNIQLITTSTDVIHSFFVPSLGMQRYAIPGRHIRMWFKADKPGLYIGECNQICGTNHSRMPINIVAVPQKEFEAWVVYAKKQFASDAKPSNDLMASAGGLPAPVR